MGATTFADRILTGATKLITVDLPNNRIISGMYISVGTSEGPIFVSAYLGYNAPVPVIQAAGFQGWIRSDANGMGSDSILYVPPRGKTMATQLWRWVLQFRNDTGSTVDVQYGASWEDA